MIGSLSSRQKKAFVPHPMRYRLMDGCSFFYFGGGYWITTIREFVLSVSFCMGEKDRRHLCLVAVLRAHYSTDENGKSISRTV